MKYTIDNVSEFSKKIVITVPVEKIDSQFQEQYNKLQQTAEIKGFRKGKTPLETLKKLHHAKVKYEVMEKLIQSAYVESIVKEKLNPIGQPHIHLDNENWNEKEELKFTAEFEVFPQLNITNYEKMELTDKKVTIDDNRLQQTLEMLQKQKALTKDVVDRKKAEKGDIANIDFDGFVDEKPLEGGSMKAFDLELGSSSFIPGFEDKIIGMEVGEKKDLKLKFPASYQKKELENKDVLFKVELKALKQKELPTIDDEFAKGFSFKSLDEFKEIIKKDLLEEAQGQNKKDLEEQLFEKLIEKNSFNLPEKLVAQQKAQLITESQKELKEKGLNKEQIKEYEKKWDGEFNTNAEKILKVSLVIQELAHKLNLKCDDAAIEKKLQEHAKTTGIELQKVKEFYAPTEKKNQLAYQIERAQLVKHLLSSAVITVK
ncbi:MAG: trigger factor [Bdellovibrionaceae bacterium]|nr:trigger factor [Pseudobdellovibrionaceae bacterium]